MRSGEYYRRARAKHKCHGRCSLHPALPVFWALASDSAINILGSNRAGKALSLITFGVVCATVSGIPIGALIADWFGWRSAFGILAVVAFAKAAMLQLYLPKLQIKSDKVSVLQQFKLLRDPVILGHVCLSILLFTAMFTTYTYLADMLEQIPAEMDHFLAWLNDPNIKEPTLLRAGLGHLWFVTLHPFDDGNGRIARAIGNLLLARADGSTQRFYSLSAQIQRERKAYYDILERTQKGDMDVTGWLEWFLATLLKAVEQAHGTLDQVLAKAKFWQQAATIPMNKRQIKVLNRLLDGFEGNLTTSKWAAIAKCSQDTALRDITELVQYEVLQKTAAGGRSTNYEVRHYGFKR